MAVGFPGSPPGNPQAMHERPEGQQPEEDPVPVEDLDEEPDYDPDDEELKDIKGG